MRFATTLFTSTFLATAILASGSPIGRVIGVFDHATVGARSLEERNLSPDGLGDIDTRDPEPFGIFAAAKLAFRGAKMIHGALSHRKKRDISEEDIAEMLFRRLINVEEFSQRNFDEFVDRRVPGDDDLD